MIRRRLGAETVYLPELDPDEAVVEQFFLPFHVG
jgi:transposase